MRSNYKKLGEYIRPVDERNRDLAITNLQGVSITKEFVPSIANIIGTDLSTYKIVRKGQFAYGPVTSRNGDKVSIALLRGDDCIISSSYSPFEVYKPDELLPEYLMLWFMRPEFDRYARFMSNGSAREVFDWDCMCGVELPVPLISEQRKIVHDYQVITDRIALLRKMNECLTNIAKQVFISKFIDNNEHENKPLREMCEVTSGKRVPKELDFSDVKTKHPYIRVRDIHDGDYACLTDAFEYIDDQTYAYISKYTVIENDIIVSSVGTVGLIGRIHHTLQDANLTENCFRVRCYNSRYVDYIFYALSCYKDLRLLESIIDGSVQAKLPLEKFRSFPICSPTDDELNQFNSVIRPIKQRLDRNNSELLILAEVLAFTKSRIIKGA